MSPGGEGNIVAWLCLNALIQTEQALQPCVG